MLSTTDLPDSAAGRYSYEQFRVVKRRTVTEEMCNDRLRGMGLGRTFKMLGQELQLRW